MDAACLGYTRRDNGFTWLEYPEQAKRLMDRDPESAWQEMPSGIARSLNPEHDATFPAFPMEYSRSTYQSERASDIMFRKPAALARLYPKLIHHGLTAFLSPDVMRFLGRTRLPLRRRGFPLAASSRNSDAAFATL